MPYMVLGCRMVSSGVLVRGALLPNTAMVLGLNTCGQGACMVASGAAGMQHAPVISVCAQDPSHHLTSPRIPTCHGPWVDPQLRTRVPLVSNIKGYRKVSTLGSAQRVVLLPHLQVVRCRQVQHILDALRIDAQRQLRVALAHSCSAWQGTLKQRVARQRRALSSGHGPQTYLALHARERLGKTMTCFKVADAWHRVGFHRTHVMPVRAVHPPRPPLHAPDSSVARWTM